MIDFLAIHDRYIEDVLSDRTPACRLVKLVCERAKRDHARKDEGWPYAFDPQKAIAPAHFISRLHFVQDSITTKSGEPFALRDDQIFRLVEIFGWYWRGTSDRRFLRVYLEIPRGNGKSMEQSAIALYMVATESGNAQILCAASLKEQARIVLDRSREMCAQDEDLRDAFGLEVTANTIKQVGTGNVMRALSATATSVEGTAPNMACLDELHAAKGRALWTALDTGTSKRKNGLFVAITTAGDNDAGIGKEVHDYTEQVLTGGVEDESHFGMIFTIDETDLWTDPLAWKRANPGLGISIDERALASECKRAQAVPGQRPAFKSRHLNCWMSFDIVQPFFEEFKLDKCFDATMNPENFTGDPCEVGLDLATRTDLTSMVRAHFRTGDDGKLYVYAFQQSWLPETPMKEHHVAAYDKWVENGELSITPGDTTDYAKIEEFFLEGFFKYSMRGVSFDPMQSAYLMVRLQQQTGNSDMFVEMPQHGKNMTPGMLLAQELVADGRLKTNSSLLIWALKNLRVRRIGSSLVQPVRSAQRANKIDPAVALVMALSRISLSPSDGYLVLPRSMTF